MTKTAKPLKKKPADEAADLPELYSTLHLEHLLGVNRLTIKKRLRAAGIDPHPTSTEKNTLYELTEALKIAATRTDSDKDEKTIQSIDLKNRKLELELQRLTGEVTPNKDVEEHTSDLFGGLYKRIVVQDVKGLIRKVRAAKTEEDALKIAQKILGQTFAEAKANYTKFLK